MRHKLPALLFGLALLTGCAIGHRFFPQSSAVKGENLDQLRGRIAELDSKIRVSDNDAGLRLDRADLLVQAGEPARALADCERAMTLQPSWMRARVQTGQVLWRTHRGNDATKLHVTKDILRVSDPAILSGLLRDLGREDRKIDLNPNDPAPLVARSRVLRLLDQFSLALADTEAAFALDDDSVMAHLEAAYSLGATGRPAEALSQATQAAHLNPQNPEAWEFCGLLEAEMGDCHAAIESQTRSLKLRESAAALRAREKCFRRLGQKAEAERDRERLRELEARREKPAVSNEH